MRLCAPHRIFSLAPATLSLYSFLRAFEVHDNQVPENLFEDCLFKLHAKSVVEMLESAVQSMAGNDVSSLGNTLQELGARHVSYGVHPAHYSVVQTALLRVLEGALGDHWTTDARRGWSAVFKFLSKAMQAGAGAEVEIIKGKRREIIRGQSATLRLRVIKRSEGTSRLLRSRFLDSNSANQRGLKSQPPRIPARTSDELDPQSKTEQ